MTIEEITKLEKYLFLRLSHLYSDSIYTVDYSMREVRTSYHRISFALYGKYNNYITVRPSLTLYSDQVASEVCNIYDINDDICYHSLFSTNLISKNSEKVFDSYPDGFIFNKLSSQDDIDEMISNIEKFMKNGCSDFIMNTHSLGGVESFLNKRISQFLLSELNDSSIKAELRKFYRDPRIIRSGIIARYLIDSSSADNLVQKYMTLFENVEIVTNSAIQIVDFYNQSDSNTV